MRTCVTLLALLPLLFGCSSTPEPAEWSDTEWPETRENVSRVVIGVLTNKFGYRLDDYQEFPEKNLITLRTSWNLRGAERAVFSGSGIRRMAFVEIEEIEVPGGHIPMPPGANEKTSRPMFKEITLDNGQRRFVTTKLALSVRQERNVSILEADDPSKGDWEDYGSDSEEIEQILVMIRSRIDEMAGREFGMSERAKKAHEDYLKEGQLTPEEIDERYDRLKDKK